MPDVVMLMAIAMLYLPMMSKTWLCVVGMTNVVFATIVSDWITMAGDVPDLSDGAIVYDVEDGDTLSVVVNAIVDDADFDILGIHYAIAITIDS